MTQQQLLSSGKRREAIIEAVKAAKRSQFKATAIKVELEAQFWRSGEFGGTEFCHDWIMERLEPLGLAVEGDGRELSHGAWTEWEPAGALAYAEFYRDGSVDSEFTFTLMLTNPADVLVLPKIVKIFKDLGRANEGEFDVRGAGMHMAFLNSSDGNYPTYHTDDHYARLQNFGKSMSLLIPALYFLGSSNENSRGLGYRRPQIGFDTHRAAIDYRGGALEFRVFDTCYDKPEAILDNLVVMSKCLRYWRMNYLSSGLEKITSRTRFGVDSGDNLDRFYVTYEHVDLLNQGLARLKPSYYTIREIKLQRKFQVNRRYIDKRKAEQTKAAEIEYSEYEERFSWQLVANRGRYMQRLATDMEFEVRSGIREPVGSQQESLALVEERADELIEQEKARKKSVKQYVRDKLNEFERNNRGEFTLAVD